MNVRCKMKVEGIEAATYGDEGQKGGAVRLAPVISGSPENESFYKYTPGGSLFLSTINQSAFDQFKLGQEFYVDLIPADPPKVEEVTEVSEVSEDVTEHF